VNVTAVEVQTIVVNGSGNIELTLRADPGVDVETLRTPWSPPLRYCCGPHDPARPTSGRAVIRRLLRFVWNGFVSWAMSEHVNRWPPPLPDNGARPVVGCRCALCLHPDFVRRMTPPEFVRLHQLEVLVMRD
jgi:hypothetical protein